MVFSSVLFLVYFLPVFLLVYHIVPKRFKNYIFLFFSLIFYAWGAPDFFFILMLSIGLDYVLVSQIHKASNPHKAKALLSIVFIKSLGLLFYFKYSNFFVENINEILGLTGALPIPWKKVLLPIGISFYTFQSLTYGMDVYKKRHAALKNIFDYYLYIMAFPQMIAGPIVQFHQIADYLVDREEKYVDKIQGLFRFSLGLAKKVLIANQLAEFSNYVIQTASPDMPVNYAWLGMLAYTFQIYFDFSGYSDMALGLGKMLGLPFPENFDNPYTSKSISEFWRRWHMTLNAWMRDYLYIPLGGNKKGLARTYLNLWIVFLLSGLWHGDSWNFVLWGAFHGFLLVIERLFLGEILAKLPSFISIFYTFFMVFLGWTLFCTEDLKTWKGIILGMGNFDYVKTIYISNKFYIALAFASLFAFFNVSKWGQKVQNLVYYPNTIGIASLSFRVISSIILVVFCLAQLAGSSFNPFIYYRF